MASRNERFPSKYFKACDLFINGVATDKTLTITHVDTTTYDDGTSAANLHFQEWEKTLGCNMINWDDIARMCGSDDDSTWGGLRVTFTPGRANRPGVGMVDAVRVKSVLKPGQQASEPQQTAQASPEQAVQASPEADDVPIMQLVTTTIFKVEQKIVKQKGVSRTAWVADTAAGSFGTFDGAVGGSLAAFVEGSPTVEIGWLFEDGSRWAQYVMKATEQDTSLPGF